VAVGVCVGIAVTLADGCDDGREVGASVTKIGANVLNENGNKMSPKLGDSVGAYVAIAGALVCIETEDEGAIDDVGELEYCDPVDAAGNGVGPDGTDVGFVVGYEEGLTDGTKVLTHTLIVP